jgi:hypothetical protein
MALGSIVLLAGFSACERAEILSSHEFEKHELVSDPEKVELPEGLWQKLTSLLVKQKMVESGEKAATSADNATADETLPTEFEPLKVFLIEKNHGILGGHDHEFEFAAGGGAIDLNDVVQDLRGSFYFKVEFMPDVELTESKVYYLSDALVRRRRSEKVGAGCNVYFDVSTAFAKAKQDGFLLNTSEQRHISAMAGTYFFAALYEQKLHLASLTITDSHNRDLLCPKRNQNK